MKESFKNRPESQKNYKIFPTHSSNFNLIFKKYFKDRKHKNLKSLGRITANSEFVKKKGSLKYLRFDERQKENPKEFQISLSSWLASNFSRLLMGGTVTSRVWVHLLLVFVTSRVGPTHWSYLPMD